MSYFLTEEQQLIKNSVREFCIGSRNAQQKRQLASRKKEVSFRNES